MFTPPDDDNANQTAPIGLVFTPRFATGFINDPLAAVEWEWSDVPVPGTDETRYLEFPTSWSLRARTVVASKYFRVGRDGPETSLRQVVTRVVDAIRAEGLRRGYYADTHSADVHRAELAVMILTQRMAFNSPVWFNVGIEDEPQVSACYIVPIDDDMESILQHYVVEGRIYNRGSGSGTNYSALRGSNEMISSGGTSSGPLAFIRGHDAAGGSIKSGGATRRAAKMVILDADHPDAPAFVEIKAGAERAAHALVAAGWSPDFRDEAGAYSMVHDQNANHSLRVTDAFMEQATDGDPEPRWALTNRLDGSVFRTVSAREMLERAAASAWVCGDPGLQFDDAIQRMHTTPSAGRINGSNPCQPGFATVLTPEGVRTFNDIDVGSVIWSGKQWTNVKRKIATGVKSVYRFGTPVGAFVGTADHQVIQNGRRVRAIEATGIDVAVMPGKTPTGETVAITSRECIGTHRVWDITVDADEHTYWTDNLLVSNCSEFVYLDNTSCNLASLNLVTFFDCGTERTFIDDFAHAIRCTTVAMDILVSLGRYPTDEIRDMTLATRPLGVGYTNLGALLMRWGLPYDSVGARGLAADITSLMAAAAWEASAEMAEALGAFDLYKYSANRVTTRSVLGTHLDAAAERSGGPIGSVAVDTWQRARDAVAIHGVRNAQLTVLAPTGTISLMMDADTFGVEPATAPVASKRLVGGGSLVMGIDSITPALEWLGYDDAVVRHVTETLERTGRFPTDAIRREHLDVFAAALPGSGIEPIHWRGHLDMMAAVQPFLSGAISKTVGIPHDSTPADITDIYIAAWRLGLKAVAVYRDGCKATQPLEVVSDRSDGSEHEVAIRASHALSQELEASADAGALVERFRSEKYGAPTGTPIKKTGQVTIGSSRRRLPMECRSVRRKFTIGGHDGYIHVGLYDDGRPGEIFVRMAKEGSVVSGFVDSWATAVSIALQYGAPLDVLADKFVGAQFDPSGWTGDDEIPMARSVPDLIFRWLTSRFGGNAGVAVAAEEPVGKPANSSPPVQTAVSGDGPLCARCGVQTTRDGKCWVCPSCGDGSGCAG